MFYSFDNASFLFAFGTIFFLTIVPFFDFKQSKYTFTLPLVGAVALVFFGYRTAAVSAISIFVLWVYLKNNFKLQLAVIALGICLVTFFIKSGSTSGRWFIIKRTIEILRDNPNGIGFGNFKVVYGLHQAHYFKSHFINDTIALGADNTEFALNEYLQVAIEGGIFQGAVFLLFTILLLFVGFKVYKLKQQKILLAFMTGFTALSFANLWFYMLHNYWVLTFYIICVLGIYLFFIFNKRTATSFSFCAGLILISITLFKNYKSNFLKKKLETASTLSSVGYKSYADSVFKSVNDDSLNVDYQLIMANHCLRYNNPEQAILEMEKVNKQITNDGNYLLTGDAYLALGDTLNAIKYYLTAIYSVPKRFSSRKKLANVYQQTNDRVKEIYWLQSIINLPEKVPSKITKQIKEEAQQRLIEIAQPKSANDRQYM